MNFVVEDARFTFEPMMSPFSAAIRSMLILASTFLLVSGALCQDWRLEGTVNEANSPMGLPGASVFVGDLGALTNIDGQFELSGTTPGPKVVRVRYVGYVEWSDTLAFWTGTTTLDISLQPDVASIGTAVISAGRFEQDLGEVSVSIDVLPPELMNQGAPTSADQSLSRTPGVTIVDSEPQIRGGSGYSFGAGSRVAVLLDGLPVLSGDAGRPTWGFLPLENLEQVEVVKGASSVLYGSSALSGVIQFRTAFPDPEPFTRVSVQHGIQSNPGQGRKYWDHPLMQSSTSWLHPRRLTLTATASALAANGWEAMGTKDLKLIQLPGQVTTEATILLQSTTMTHSASGA